MSNLRRCALSLLRLGVVALAWLSLVAAAPSQQPTPREQLDAAFQKGIALFKQGKAAEAISHLENAATLAVTVFGPEDVNTAALANVLADACRAAGRNKDAEINYARSLKILEAKLGADHPRLGVPLNNLAVLYLGMARHKEALSLFERALRIEEKHHGKDHIEIAGTLNNLGALQHAMGRYADAETSFARSLRIKEQRLGKDHAELAATLINLAATCRSRGRLPDAETHARRALAIADSKPGKDGKDDLQVASALNVLGLILQGLSRFAEAETAFTRCLAIREARLGESHPVLAAALNNLAGVQQDLGRFQKAETLYRRCLTIQQKHLGTDHPDIATTLNNLAQLNHDIGRFKEAESLFQQSLAIRERRLGKDHPLIGDSLSNIVGLMKNTGRVAEALPYLVRSLDIAERSLGKDHLETARRRGNMASLLKAAGKHAEAEPLFLECLATLEVRLGKDHAELVPPMHNLAVMYWSLGRLAEAERLLVRALAIQEKNYGKDSRHLVTLLIPLAGIYQATGRHAEAVATHDRALRIGQRDLQDILAFSSEAAMHDSLQFIEGHLPGMISLAHGSDAAAATALDWCLRRKGIVFDTLCRFRQAQQLLAPDDELSKKLGQYRGLKELLARSALQPPPGTSATEHRKQLGDWRRQADAIEAELNRGLIARLPASQADAATAETVRKRLPDNAALVEFVRVSKRDFKSSAWQPPRYLAFVLTPGSQPPRCLDLGDAKDIDAGVAAVRKEFLDFQEKLRDCESPEEANELEVAQEKLFKKTGRALHDRLMAPLRQSLGNAKTLYVAPDGELNRLPFEALVDHDDKYLVETQRFAYLSSGRDLLRDAEKPARGTVVFADPDFKLDAQQRLATAEKLLAKKIELAVAAAPGRELRSVGWKQLGGAAAEARDIDKALSDSGFGPVKTYAGAEALEEVFKSLKPPRILHLATHGFFLDHEPAAQKDDENHGSGAGAVRGRLRQLDNPLLRSGIVLAGANTAGDKQAASAEDGWVTAEEIALLNLRGTELVVLSACQTGLGDVKTGEGVFGLRRAFLHAGASSLLTSLFEVPDRETRELMRRFYGNLRAGQGKLAALHAAQLELVRQRRQANAAAHPFFWASFILVGDPG